MAPPTPLHTPSPVAWEWRCSAKAKTLVCHQHCFSHKPQKNPTSIPARPSTSLYT